LKLGDEPNPLLGVDHVSAVCTVGPAARPEKPPQLSPAMGNYSCRQRGNLPVVTRALAALGQLCRKHGLSVITFTGYEHNRLVAERREDWKALLAVTDLLLAGPFLEDQKDFSRPWVGSRNQEFVFLTDRYRHLQTDSCPAKNGLEIHIASDGGVRLNGLVPGEDILSLRQELALLGLQILKKESNHDKDYPDKS